jgi:hypothetical protein
MVKKILTAATVGVFALGMLAACTPKESTTSEESNPAAEQSGTEMNKEGAANAEGAPAASAEVNKDGASATATAPAAPAEGAAPVEGAPAPASN